MSIIACFYVCMHIHTYIYTYTYTCIFVHVYICIYIYMQLYIHSRQHRMSKSHYIFKILFQKRPAMLQHTQVFLAVCAWEATTSQLWPPHKSPTYTGLFPKRDLASSYLFFHLRAHEQQPQVERVIHFVFTRIPSKERTNMSASLQIVATATQHTTLQYSTHTYFPSCVRMKSNRTSFWGHHANALHIQGSFPRKCPTHTGLFPKRDLPFTHLFF